MSVVETVFPLAFYRSDKYIFPNGEIDEFNKCRSSKDLTLNVGKNLVSKETYLLNLPTLTKLKEFVQFNLNNYWHDVMKVTTKVPIEITQSWLNFNPKGTFHHMHHHSNSIVSGVIFVQGKGSFLAERGINHFPMWDLAYDEVTLFNSEKWEVEATRGHLILFPSSVKHTVKENTEEEERVSVAFNTMARGPLGKRPNLTEVML
jgi:uncharacterized protein (TIGR02466 family)